MLEEKTKGNLTPPEQSELRRVLTSLRLNFVEETKKASTAGAKAQEEAVRYINESYPDVDLTQQLRHRYTEVAENGEK